MELQNKFEEIINRKVHVYNNVHGWLEGKEIAAKECAKLCLEEKIKLLEYLIKIGHSLNDYKENLQQQLKELDNGK